MGKLPVVYLGHVLQTNFSMGRGGGLVVSALAFYSDDPSSNPAEAYSFFCKMFEMNENILKSCRSWLN